MSRASLIIPTAGVPWWSIIAAASGALFASIAMRLLGERWWPAHRTPEAANLVWATTLPIAGLAIVLSLL